MGFLGIKYQSFHRNPIQCSHLLDQLRSVAATGGSEGRRAVAHGAVRMSGEKKEVSFISQLCRKLRPDNLKHREMMSLMTNSNKYDSSGPGKGAPEVKGDSGTEGINNPKRYRYALIFNTWRHVIQRIIPGISCNSMIARHFFSTSLTDDFSALSSANQENRGRVVTQNATRATKGGALLTLFVR